MVEPPAFSNSLTEGWNYSEASWINTLTEPWNYHEPGPWLEPGISLRYPKSIMHLGIGPSADLHENLFAIEYGGDQPLGSGQGGDLITPQTVLNMTMPTGVLHHNKWWIVTLGIREDVYKALFQTAMSDSLMACEMAGDNPEIPYFVIHQLGADGAIRKVTYTTVYLANVDMSKTTTEDGKFIIELKFLAKARSFAGNSIYESWGYPDPTFAHTLTEAWAYSEPPTYSNSITEAWSS